MRVALTCQQCGKVFTVRPYAATQRYCSHSCAGFARTNPQQIMDMLRLRAQGTSTAAIARAVGCDQRTVCRHAPAPPRVVLRKPPPQRVTPPVMPRSELRVWCPECGHFGTPASKQVCECGARRDPGYEPVEAGDRA